MSGRESLIEFFQTGDAVTDSLLNDLVRAARASEFITLQDYQVRILLRLIREKGERPDERELGNTYDPLDGGR